MCGISSDIYVYFCYELCKSFELSFSKIVTTMNKSYAYMYVVARFGLLLLSITLNMVDFFWLSGFLTTFCICAEKINTDISTCNIPFLVANSFRSNI